MKTQHINHQRQRRVIKSPLLLAKLTILLVGIKTSWIVHANSFSSNGRGRGRLYSHIAQIMVKGGSINFESVPASTASSSNGTTATYECVMSSLNENNGSNETQIDTPVTGNTIFSGHEDGVSGVKEEPITVDNKKKTKVLFLSADTGGGHRASAESLANQLLKYNPNTDYELLDLWTPTNVYPYKTLVNTYKHLSAHPSQWRILYYISNTKIYEKFTDLHSQLTCYKKIEAMIEERNPDIVISVHPTMNYIPEKAVRNIAKKQGKYIPFFTVVTDFGSGHCTWFQGNPDMLYVASERISKLARKRGGFSDDNMVLTGLPIREDFAVQAENMGDRTSDSGKEYRKKMKLALGLDPNKKMVLLMGGGEGVGSLAKIAAAVRMQLKEDGVDAAVCVICGRNEKLKNELNEHDWDALESMSTTSMTSKKSIMGRLMGKKRSIDKDSSSISSSAVQKGNVDVIGLGFITNMADYMVASDVLVSKAGPGTIAEAAAVGLPVMITSFLPGQEAGNVDIVLDGEFGAFSQKPRIIANTVSSWLKDDNDDILDRMSRRSREAGNPQAASDIIQDIIKHSIMKMEVDHL